MFFPWKLCYTRIYLSVRLQKPNAIKDWVKYVFMMKQSYLLFTYSNSCHKNKISICNFSVYDFKASFFFLIHKGIVFLNSLDWFTVECVCLKVQIVGTCRMNSLRPVWPQWTSSELIIMGPLSVTITFTVCYCFYTYEPWGYMTHICYPCILIVSW